MKKYLLVLIFFVICVLSLLFFVLSWWWALTVGLIILGTLGYIEKILNTNWPKNWKIFFLILFVTLSIGQATYSRYKERVTNKQFNLKQRKAAEQVAALHARSNEAALSAEEAKLRATDAQQKQQQLQRENLELSLQVEKERRARVKLEEQLAPRRLSKANRALIINAMSRFRGMTIKVQRRGEMEPYAYANEIAQPLQASGLRVQVDGGMGGMSPPEYGVIWWARKENPDIGNALSKLFTDLQIPNQGYFIKDLDADAALSVGLKPPKINSSP